MNGLTTSTIKRIMMFLYDNNAPFNVEEIQTLKMAVEHLADCENVGDYWKEIAMKMCGK